MLRNGVTPIPPASHTCRRLASASWENEPYGPSTTASAPASSLRRALV